MLFQDHRQVIILEFEVFGISTASSRGVFDLRRRQDLADRGHVRPRAATVVDT
jgi:hypothetical protein